MASKLKQFVVGENISDILQKQNKGSESGTPDADQFIYSAAMLEETDVRTGLTSAEVEDRIAQGLDNNTTVNAGKSVKEIIKSNVFTYFNLIFAVLATLMFSVGAWRNTMFLLVVVSNAFIGIVQELRSKKAVDRLTILSEGTVTALRDGNKTNVKTSSIVLDDLIEFHAGDQIPADACVRDGEVSVNEALLTGESDSIVKRSGDSLRSGSSVVSGKCLAQITQVGADSYASRLTLKAKEGAGVGKSEMMASLDKLVKIIGFALIPVGIALFVQQLVSEGLAIQENLTTTVAALVGMIPEGLYLLTSVALALAVVRLSQKNVLVRDMNCVETLARVDTLCVDKTGTITEPGMNVEELITLPEIDEIKVRTMLRAFYGAIDADNETAAAMASAFYESPEAQNLDTSDWKVKKTVPFSSETKWSAVSFEGKGTFLIGAPEFILGSAASQLSQIIDPYTSKGFRVLLAAVLQKDGTARPLALVVISNKIRANAVETFSYFAEQGVEIKVISGDSPKTVSQVATLAGIANADRYVDATMLDTDDKIEAAAAVYTVFGRVTPSQKLKLVKALKAAGRTVAMTGDGVNDVLALKEADCGVAMASGSQAASQISQLVLLDSDFSAMPDIVGEGRRVINNIQRSASLFLVKNIFSFIFAVISIFAAFPYPLQPNQLSLISSLTIGIPGCFLALQPNNSIIKGKFLPNVILRALPGGLTDVTLMLILELIVYHFNLDTDILYSIAPILMLTVGLWVLRDVSLPFDRFRKILWIAITVVTAVVVIITPYTFLTAWIAIEKLDWQALLILALLMLISYPVMLVYTKLFKSVSRIGKM